MDLIESIDWGGNAHFRYLANQHPRVIPYALDAFDCSTPLSVGGIILVAAFLFLLQRRPRAAFIVVIGYLASITIIIALHDLVPTPKPDDAQRFLPSNPMVGGYPSSGVFLFTLGVVFLGFALEGLLLRWWPRLAYCFVAGLLTLWVCVSQFLLCIHFVTDVLGGLVGAALVSWVAYHNLQPRMANREEAENRSDRLS